MRILLTVGLLVFSLSSCADGEQSAAEARKPKKTAGAGVILQYHHVDGKTPPVTSTTPELFAEHMAYLAANDFTIWPLPDLVATLRSGDETPERTVAITFDDAYLSIYTAAFPILEAYGWPFTIFVATDPVESNQFNFLTWDQLGEMKAAGATIANHTHTHAHMLRRLNGESESAWRNRITDEITRAQTIITDRLGDAPKLFAYPYGEHDAQVIDIVESLGYLGFGQQSGAMGSNSDFRILPRFPMGGSYAAMDTFGTKAATLPLPVDHVYVDPMLSDDLTPSLTLRFDNEHPRLNQLVCYGPGGPTQLEKVSATTFIATNRTPVPVGRSRYNCTMPSGVGDRFYWYSQMWIRKRDDGSWYPEP